ncbi:MAG TPA: cysteine desulfurase family protein [Candidatus Doudnabacteria bacterium]|nr:cysteine desulfurase family protein [Candidatus Doudnabacteria bacterium]
MKSNIYLDNAASTKPTKAVLEAMKPFLEGYFGNPSSLHELGVSSKQTINSSREQVAKVLNCRPSETIFTSGGTESINLAIFGVAKSYLQQNKKPGRIIVSEIEHEAVLESVKALKTEGWKIDFLPVDKLGFVHPKDLSNLIKPDTALVSIMYANNEVGSIQPIAQLGSLISGINRTRKSKNLPNVVFHTDACQAGGSLELDILKLKVDLLTLNGSKINGPKGAGILFVRTGTKIKPLIYGGGQERGLRSGTENTPAIIGFTTALQLAQKNRLKNVKTLHNLQTFLEINLKKIAGVMINGPKNSKLIESEFNFGLHKLPGTTNFSVKNVESESLMLYLDAAGFAVATGSACTTGSEDPSHVLLAMGIKPALAKSTIRISLGYNITKANLSKFVTVLSKTVGMLRKTQQDI